MTSKQQRNLSATASIAVALRLYADLHGWEAADKRIEEIFLNAEQGGT